jgi:hypothetical protein
MPRRRYVASYRSFFGYKPGSQEFTFISPDRFLSLASKRVFTNRETGERREYYDESALKKLRERMESGKPIDPLFLDVESGTCQVVDHEGRHRAIAAKQVGIDKLPLILYCKTEHGRYANVSDCAYCFQNKMRLLPQKARY